MKLIDKLLTKVKNKSLLIIYPHPDDETFMSGGLLLYAKSLGFKTTVSILTDGEAGQIHIHPRGRTVRQIRLEELRKATNILQVDDLRLAHLLDGKLTDQKAELKNYILNLVHEVKPGIVVTYDPSGWTGHPDHITSALMTKECLKNHFPNTRLLWVTNSFSNCGIEINKNVESYMTKPHYKVPLSRIWTTKWRAARQYKSQRFSNTKLFTTLRIIRATPFECYHQVKVKQSYPYAFVEFKI